MELVSAIYRVTAKFPDSDRFRLADEMRRTTLGIPSSIADGHTRADSKSTSSFSVAKLQTEIEIAGRLGFMSEFEPANLSETCDSLNRQLKALRTALAARLPKHDTGHV